MSKRTRENPKVGTHPDLFGRDQWGYPGETTDVVVEDWRLASPNDIRAAVALPGADQDDIQSMLEEMNEYREQAALDGDLSALLADGMSHKLAVAVAGFGKRSFILELEDLVEYAQEARIRPFIDYIREICSNYADSYVGEGDGGIQEEVFDRFQTDLEDMSLPKLIGVAESVLSGDVAALEQLNSLDEGALAEILRDPGMYRIELNENRYGRSTSGFVWGWLIGGIEYQHEGTKYDAKLEAIINGEYPGMRDDADDFQKALSELENNDPYVSFGWSKKDVDRDLFRRSFTISISKYSDAQLDVIMDEDALRAKLAELASEPVQVGPEHDDIVYRYSGTNDSVAGASARGMYVAKLAPRDLRREGATQGICIGREDLGHPRALRDGQTKVYSIRTEAGKPKFTIELKKATYHPRPSAKAIEVASIDGSNWFIAEVKGKANRIAGFEAGKDTFSKPDDVRLVADFLLSLGFSPAAISEANDTAPGVEAMKEKGVDPFAPPPAKKLRPHRDPRAAQQLKENPGVSMRVRKLLQRAKPMGALSVVKEVR